MAKYKVFWKEVVTKYATIEADSPDEASEIVIENQGDIDDPSEDDVEFKCIEFVEEE